MVNDRTYVYAVHIATTAEKLWQALTDNAFIQQYWGGEWRMESDWKTGSPVTFRTAAGDFFSEGEVLESDPPNKLSHTWPNPPEEQGDAPPETITWEITSSGPGTVKLTLLHGRLSEEFYQRVGRGWPKILSSLKSLVEAGGPLHFTKGGSPPGKAAKKPDTSDAARFVYVTYIATTPEKLWQALTDPAFTFRYWGAGLHSDWKKGSPVLWEYAPGEPLRDLEQVVLESVLYRRLVYTWHTYQPEHAAFFGWPDAVYAELVKEKRSKVTFEIEPLEAVVRLTVTHDGFEADTEMLKAVSGRKRETGGWPELLSGLKTLLETGRSMSTPEGDPEKVVGR